MRHIFISYSHKERAYANKLADEMKRRGIEPWIDERIDYGDQWPHVIQEQLEASAAVAIIMSTDAYKSRWVQNELTFAQHIGKEIFPLLLEGKLWLSLSSTQHVDVRNGKLPPDSYFNKLKSLVEGTPAVPAIRNNRKPSSAPRGPAIVPDARSLQNRIYNLLAQAVRDGKDGKWDIGLYVVTYQISGYLDRQFLGCAFRNADLLRQYDPAVYAEYAEYKVADDQMMSTSARMFDPFSDFPGSENRNTNDLEKLKIKLKLSSPAGAFSKELNDTQLQGFVEKIIQNHIDHHVPLDQIKIQAVEY